MDCIRIKVKNPDGTWSDVEPTFFEARKAVDVKCWYDRHRRNWVIYPVDAEGNQLKEASYGFCKKEAMEIRNEMLKEIKEDE
jgi:hypothetical protein